VGTSWQFRISEAQYELKVLEIEKVKGVVGSPDCAKVGMRMRGKTTYQSFEHLALGRVAAGQDKEGTPALLRYSFEGKPATPPIPILLLPADKKVWTVNCKLDGKPLKGTFVKTEEDVSIPAFIGGGKRRAVKVSAKNLTVNNVDLSIAYWFISGIGMVRQEVDIAGQKVVIELEGFKAGK
jgi:hypothetical protein